MSTAVMTGLLALNCSVQDVNPLLQTAEGKPYALSLSARDGHGAMSGAEERLAGQQKIEMLRAEDGSLLLRGLSFRDGGEEAWAVLRPNRFVDEYGMEWLMYDHVARDGRRTVAAWAKGHCERIGRTKENIQ